jgi:hypothetical protein
LATQLGGKAAEAKAALSTQRHVEHHLPVKECGSPSQLRPGSLAGCGGGA